ncbi:MAG: flagellar hook-length control protein FliK [Planctomycetota bacterium]|jgi:flagellar hook-length control protein FliK
MNTGLLTNTFIGNVGVGPTTSKPIAEQNSRQFAPAPADNPQHANTIESTTDNTLNIAQNERIDKPPQEFRYTLGKKTTTEGQQNGQNPTSDRAEQPDVVQTWLAQYPLVEHGKKGIARKMGPKAGYELAQLLADLSTGKSPPPTGLTARPVTKAPLTTVDKGWLGLKALVPDTSGAMLVTGTQPAERKIAGKIQVSSKTLITTKGLINQQNGRELDSEALTADGKTAKAGEKPAIEGTSVAAGSQKTPVLGGQKLTHETTTTGSKTAVAGEKTAITDEQAIPGGQKATVEPEKSALIEVKPKQDSRTFQTSAENKDVFNSETGKADTPRRNHPGTPGLSELTDGNGKEKADNPSAKLLLQNLNHAQVQIATGQTKENRSSTSDNSSNSSFEQLLSNNAQVPIAEQTPASAQTAKVANNASTPNPFASVSEQLQESIHSSLRQGDQQLTIRLNPPELGRVFIKFQGKGDQITGLLEVDRAQTRYEIEQALPQLIRNLAECGVQIKRLEVVLTNQQEQHAFKDTSLAAQQDDWAGQQAGAERNNPDHDSFGTNEWLTNGTGYSEFSEPQEMFIADGFVDVLV